MCSVFARMCSVFGRMCSVLRVMCSVIGGARPLAAQFGWLRVGTSAVSEQVSGGLRESSIRWLWGDLDRKTPHRFRPKTPESASPLGEGEERPRLRGRRDDGDVSTRSGRCVQFWARCVNFAAGCVQFRGQCVQFPAECVHLDLATRSGFPATKRRSLPQLGAGDEDERSVPGSWRDAGDVGFDVDDGGAVG